MTIKTKYNIGDRVWVINRLDKAAAIEIATIGVSVSSAKEGTQHIIVTYSDDFGFTFSEDRCFLSKEDLLNSL